jgi:preprotein translocase subunit SecF
MVMKFNLINKRYYYFLFSLLIIIPGMIGLGLWGLPFSIDFTSGSMLEVKFQSGNLPQPADVIGVYDQLGLKDSRVQTTNEGTLVIRSRDMTNDTKTQVVSAMEKRFNDKLTILQFDTVGPAIGKEVATNAAIAVGLAALGILLYIWYAFRNIPNAYRYGVAAIIAMLHDVLVVIGVQTYLSHFLGWEFDALFLTALLTVIGFSVHDTIVVFDRVRENSSIYRRLPFEQIVNHSIIQTLDRSINTTLTVLLTLFTLALFGGVTIRHFVIILLVGIFSGAYSSIFNAAPILVVWENMEWNTWFKRKSTTTA